MIPVMQTNFDGGNCLSACLASILELPLADVVDTTPPADTEGWSQWNLVIEWLRGRGLTLWPMDGTLLRLVETYAGPRLQPHPPCAHYIGSGPSPRGSDYHAVVMYQGEIVHDPHPGKGLSVREIDMIEVLVAIDKAPIVCDAARMGNDVTIQGVR